MHTSRSTSRRGARRWTAATVALLATAAVLLGACSDSGGDGDDAPAEDTASTTSTIVNTSSLDAVQISEDLASSPTVAFDPSFAGSEAQSRVVVPGTGETLQEGQRASVDYVVVSGIDGSQLETTWGASPETIPLDEQLQEAFRLALIGQQVGARVAVSSPSQGQWVILVFDIRGAVTVPESAQGEEVPPVEGLPTVTLQDGVPTVDVPDSEPPSEVVVQPLIKGAGPAVEPGQVVAAHYVGVNWTSGEVFDSSWARDQTADFAIGAGRIIAGLDEGLVGQTIGSRVLVIIPPDQGYGEQGNPDAGIGGTDTIVFVVDLLGAF